MSARAKPPFRADHVGSLIRPANLIAAREDAAAGKKYADKFAKVDLFTLADTFGDWRTAQKKFFDDGGIFDSIYTPQ